MINPTEQNEPLLPRPIVVVGGGVIGLACADSLAQAGCQVVLIDRGKVGQGCSHGNCGYVSPSHVLPLCRPGMISLALRSLLQRDSSFQVRMRFDPQTWIWMWKFASRCNRADMIAAGHARKALLDSSRAMYGEMFQTEAFRNCDWEERGLLFIYRSERSWDQYSRVDEILKREFGVAAERLDRDQLLSAEPALKPEVAGAWRYDCDAHLRPDRLMEAWQKQVRARGVRVLEGCEFLGFESRKGKTSAILTTEGPIEADHVVIATGAWTRLLHRAFKRRIPIEPGKGYSITMPRPSLCPKTPMVLEEERVAITPLVSGYRIGSTMEFAGFDQSLRQERLQLLLTGAAKYLREPFVEPFEETWYGWRPMSDDGIPLIGRVPGFENVWLAAGHSMEGISMAPATGRLIAELITGAVPHVDPKPYGIDRG